MSNENGSNLDRLEAQCDRVTGSYGWGFVQFEAVNCPESNPEQDESDDDYNDDDDDSD